MHLFGDISDAITLSLKTNPELKTEINYKSLLTELIEYKKRIIKNIYTTGYNEL